MTCSRRILVTAAMFGLLWGPTPAARAQGSEPDSVVAAHGRTTTEPDSEAASPVDYLWVLRGSLANRAGVDSVIARATRMRVRGLLVQVVGRGDACYRSEVLPRAEFIDRNEGAEFDPFGELVGRAHEAGIEVHAWVNCLLVWSKPHRPRDPRHVVNAHPEWIAQLRDGRTMAALGARERSRKGVEGVFLSAGHPGVQKWLAAVAKEIAERYPVDGIHLDYIRHPSVGVGWDPTTRARFALDAGVDPAHMEQLDTAAQTKVHEAWESFQRTQVTAVVRAMRDSARAVRPRILISAAVIADTLRAERSNAQMWRSWVRDGLIDRAFVMCYGVPVQSVMNQLMGFTAELETGGSVVPGIAMYNTKPVTAALKIKGARAMGFPLVALYSYDSLFEERNYWDALKAQFEPGALGSR